MAERLKSAEADTQEFRNKQAEIDLKYYEAEKKKKFKRDEINFHLEILQKLAKCCTTTTDFNGGVQSVSLTNPTKSVVEAKMVEILGCIKI